MVSRGVIYTAEPIVIPELEFRERFYLQCPTAYHTSELMGAIFLKYLWEKLLSNLSGSEQCDSISLRIVSESIAIVIP
jgi:hypothetical protein